jgi:hypothetical protein
MKVLFAFVLFSVFFFFSSCSNQNEEYIVGKWKAIKWESDGQSKSNQVQNYWFHFHDDGTYQSHFGGNNEDGNYRVEYNRLYTKSKGEAEIVVEILSMTPDTMKIGMNRSGMSETLVLAHE